jgi:DNA modification methylase
MSMPRKKADARTFGQDMMRGEGKITRKANALRGNKVDTSPGGGGSGKKNAFLHKTVAELEEQAAGSARSFNTGNLTFDDNNMLQTASGTSIFDPVLCELAYRWFCPPGGVIVDPFAGGSVRGIVAAKLGFQYHGCDLSARQIAANRVQGDLICPENVPHWVNGNSLDIETLLPGVQADFVFSCPPYADLEVYSDDPRDLSQMSYEQFRVVYSDIIAAAVRMLKPDRFACFVVGDARGKDGCYYGFPWHTIEAFQRAGTKLYNEAVLVTAIGSLPVRITKQFESGRKLGKTHQNMFVFLKGDFKRATAACKGD